MSAAVHRGAQQEGIPVTGASPHLEVLELVAGYVPDVPILRGMTLSVHTGEIVTVLGPNGAGKSTLIKAVAGLVPAQSGTVRVRGQNIVGLATHKLVGAGVAYVPQVDNIFTRLSVEENLELGGMATPRELQQRVAEMYALFPDLARLCRLAAGKLSGGQRQMVAEARALMARPHFIMLDEPSAGLSPKLTEMVFQKLLDIRATGVTVLVVEQNAKAALAISDRGYVLAEGQQKFTGTARELLSSPEVGELYLGSRTRLAT
jgi:branched-chain amino acid transport system ATP-binding protein